jgi:hypothetical protein
LRERYKKAPENRAPLSIRAERGIWREGFFTGDSERYVNECSVNGHLSP